VSFQGVLDNVLRAPTRPDWASVSIDALIGRRDQLTALLEPVLSSRRVRQAIAERSYWHPNGYLKVVLWGGSGQAQLRLHVWTSIDVTGDIHDHAWPYSSVVVDGTMREAVYTETSPDHGSPMWRHSYGMVGPRRFILDAPSEVGLDDSETRVLGRGARSGGDQNRIHRFWAATSPAVTLLAVESPSRRVSHVYRSEPVLDRGVVPRSTTAGEVATWVDHALRAPCPS
jgi:hypothetical protein